MSTEQILIDTAEKIFADHCDKALLDSAELGRFPQPLWQILKENGFHQIAMVDSGLTLADAFAVIRVAGRHALPLPLAEVLLANRWTGQADRLITVGTGVDDAVIDAAWAREADAVVVVDAAGIRGLRPATGVTPGQNMAGEARDGLSEAPCDPILSSDEHAFELMALARAVQMGGCLDRVLQLCLQYAGEREQFGRTLSKFQAIQHLLAIMAAEVAAAGRAADAAVDAIGSDRFPLDVAAAKARVGEAAGIVAEQAHQVHGAMGYTHEHQLHHFTRRLWAWRDEYGNDAYWQQLLGRHVAGLGADQAWDFLATRG